MERMSMWLNNEKMLKGNLNKEKPCRILGWCPYGCIVEDFSLDELKIGNVKINCELFGHHCPMFYNAEDVSEQKKKEIIEETCARRVAQEMKGGGNNAKSNS